MQIGLMGEGPVGVRVPLNLDFPHVTKMRLDRVAHDGEGLLSFGTELVLVGREQDPVLETETLEGWFVADGDFALRTDAVQEEADWNAEDILAAILLIGGMKILGDPVHHLDLLALDLFQIDRAGFDRQPHDDDGEHHHQHQREHQVGKRRPEIEILKTVFMMVIGHRSKSVIQS